MYKKVYIMTDHKSWFVDFTRMNADEFIEKPLHIYSARQLSGLYPDKAYIISLNGYYPDLESKVKLEVNGFEVEHRLY